MKRTTVTILAAITVLVALSGSAKAAALTFTLNEVGSDVVGAVSGTLNTGGLTSARLTRCSSVVIPIAGILGIGPDDSKWAVWEGLSGSTAAFGYSPSPNYADVASGDRAAMALSANYVFVSTSYVSGSALSGTATWRGKSFATMGITTGTYTMTYNGGVDSVVLQAGIVPEPATMSLLSLGGIATLIRRRRRA